MALLVGRLAASVSPALEVEPRVLGPECGDLRERILDDWEVRGEIRTFQLFVSVTAPEVLEEGGNQVRTRRDVVRKLTAKRAAGSFLSSSMRSQSNS